MDCGFAGDPLRWEILTVPLGDGVVLCILMSVLQFPEMGTLGWVSRMICVPLSVPKSIWLLFQHGILIKFSTHLCTGFVGCEALNLDPNR